jgi:DNA-binding transcriptional ArsR family regulator
VSQARRRSRRLVREFAALADATRRGVLEQLAHGHASITDLADKFDKTLTGMKKHVGVPEQAGLVTTEKIGRMRNCKIGPCRLEEEIRLVFGDDPENAMAFFGTYLDVVPNQRIVWTNEEGGADGSVTTVTFEEKNGKTKLVLREIYPTKEALAAA